MLGRSIGRIFALLMGVSAVFLAPRSGMAAYPDRPIHLIVPFAPAGNIDATARLVSSGLSQELGQTVIVENKPGAGGRVGSEYVAHAKPDGYYCLLASTGALSALKALYHQLSFDPIKDFASAGSISRSPLVLVVNPKVPASNLKEFIKYAKAQPGKLTMASPGTGTSNHLTGELFQEMSGTKFLHVPYKGSSLALQDLISGQVNLMFDQLSSSLPHIKAGQLRALAVTTSKRSAVAPDLPTLQELGLKGFESSTTTGILFPAGTPKKDIDVFNAALVKVLHQQKVQSGFHNLGVDVVAGSPQDFTQILQEETRKWSAVVKKANIKLD